MKFKDLHLPAYEVPVGSIFYRIQPLKPYATSVKVNGLLLPPSGTPKYRFDTSSGMVCYMAPRPETALYETMFRRELTSQSMAYIASRCIVEIKAQKTLRLIDLRHASASYPLLISMSYEATQEFADQAKAAGYDGLMYDSAQHPYNWCIVVFDSGLKNIKKHSSTPLVNSEGAPLKIVVDASYRAGVPVV